MNTKTIFFAGVGGQGILLSSDIASTAAMYAGFDVKKSEVHGMAQRGGSVVSFVRYDKERVYSPLASPGTVDILLAFEKLEALRYVDYVKSDGKVIVNDYSIDPLPVSAGMQEYPKGVIENVKERKQTIVVKAFEKAREIGDLRVVNMIMPGAVSKHTGIEDKFWEQAISNTFLEKKKKSQKIVDMNIKAFKIGQEMS